MGAAASIPDRISLDQAKAFAEASNIDFNEEHFVTMSKGAADGCCSKEAFLEAAKSLSAPAVVEVGSQKMENEPSPDGVVDAASSAESCLLLRVECTLQEIEQKVEELQNSGRTPIVVDRSKDHLVDTFYGYSGCHLFDAKFVSLELAKKNLTQEEAHKKLNQALTGCLKKGQPLILACCNSVPSFSTSLNNESKFPSATVLKNSGKGFALDTEAKWGDVLFGDEERENPPHSGMGYCDPKFCVALTSHLDPEDLEEFFFDDGMGFDAFPKGDFAVVIVKHAEGTEMME